MIISISGSVGSGKTTIAVELGKKLGYEVIHLNELAKNYKIAEVEELQTFDFDLDKLLNDVEKLIPMKDNLIFEGHFAHFLNPILVDFLFVINRELGDLKEVYSQREYNEQKVSDNLEVESFNLCFHEAVEEGYYAREESLIEDGGDEEERGELGQVFSVDNNENIEEVVQKIILISKII